MGVWVLRRSYYEVATDTRRNGRVLIFLLAIAYKLLGIIPVIVLIVGMMINGLIEDEEVVSKKHKKRGSRRRKK